MATLTLAEKNKIRGMLADKQSAKTIAEELETTVEAVEALRPPKVRPRSAPPRATHRRADPGLRPRPFRRRSRPS